MFLFLVHGTISFFVVLWRGDLISEAGLYREVNSSSIDTLNNGSSSHSSYHQGLQISGNNNAVLAMPMSAGSFNGGGLPGGYSDNPFFQKSMQTETAEL